MRFPWPVVLAFVAASLPTEAVAEEGDAASGFADCEALDVRNEKELAMWATAQPPVPYKYPRTERILGAPWVELGHGFASAFGVLLTALLPNLGVLTRGALPEFLVSWPWSFSLGPASSCSRTRGQFEVNAFRPNRLMLEPSFAIAQNTTTFALRPGYRFLLHPASWFIGVGGGLGSTIELAGSEPIRPSVSPEAVVQLGSCCAPGYFTIVARGDFFFEGQRRVAASISFGVTYF